MKKILIISIAFNILIVLFFVGKRFYYSNGPGAGISQGNFYDQWNDLRNSLLTDMRIDSTDIVFVGNSLTEGFPVTEIFGMHVKNRGIAGNQTNHIVHRIKPIAESCPKKLFLEAGINDLNSGMSVDAIFNNFQLIINLIRKSSPQTTIYIQSVFPTCKDYSKLNIGIVALNAKLLSYCQSNKIYFINVHSALALGGELNSAYTIDGIHLNGAGYRTWQKAIEQYIN